MLKETSERANDAETIAHDALASIDARADEITASMSRARALSVDHDELKYSVEAIRSGQIANFVISNFCKTAPRKVIQRCPLVKLDGGESSNPSCSFGTNHE